jgi:hypothetical protein
MSVFPHCQLEGTSSLEFPESMTCTRNDNGSWSTWQVLFACLRGKDSPKARVATSVFATQSTQEHSGSTRKAHDNLLRPFLTDFVGLESTLV